MAEIITKEESARNKIRYHYCPGCGHITVHNLIGQIIDELGVREETIGIAPVGCAVTAYKYLNFDWCEAAHGRAAATATGIKRVHPEKLVFAYQGDGDLASIGLAETMHAANRGERFTVIFINNANYGMTGGQMAPTTLVGQKTTTSPKGRNPELDGYPMDMCRLISALPAPMLVARTKVTDAASVKHTREVIKKAFELQREDKGYAFIEILSNCNTNWKKSVKESNQWIDEVLVEQFPLGVFVDKYGALS